MRRREGRQTGRPPPGLLVHQSQHPLHSLGVVEDEAYPVAKRRSIDAASLPLLLKVAWAGPGTYPL